MSLAEQRFIRAALAENGMPISAGFVARPVLDEEFDGLLEELSKRVAEVGRNAPSDHAEAMIRHAEILRLEAARPHQNRRMFDLNFDGIRKAAVAIGGLGEPILQTMAELLPFLALMEAE